MPTPPEDRPFRSDAERLARRTRVHARSLAGRIFLAPGRVFLVRGRPDGERLAACLTALTAAPDAAPTPAALGFAAEEVNEVTQSGLSSRARSLQKWRTTVTRERSQGRVRAARDEKLTGYLAEIEPLAAQTAALHRLLEAAEHFSGSPYWLPPEAEAELTALTTEVAGERVVTPDLRWLVRLAAWAGGTGTARRLLLSLRDGLPFPAEQHSRAALLRVRQRAERLAELLQQLDPSPLPLPRDDEAYLAAQQRFDRERRESPLFDALRHAIAELPESLTGPGGVVVPTRNRDVNPQLVIQRCDAALADYPRPPAWQEMARFAVLYLCDGGSSALPWTFVAGRRSGTESEYKALLSETFAALLTESQKEGYDALLTALGELPQLSDYRFSAARRLLLDGVSVEDVGWCAESCGAALSEAGDGRNVRPVRATVEWLAAHEAPLDGEGRGNLWEAAAAPGGREGVTSLVRYLEWLPAQTVTPQLAAGVRSLVLLLSVPGSLRGPLRDRFRVWADPPPGTPLPEGSPENLPDELRTLLRRLAYHQRAAGQPERLPKSLRKPLDVAARHERELQFLRDNLTSLDAKQQARLRHLEASSSAGNESGSARLMRQAREVCAITALEAARALFRREIESWWRQRYGLAADLESFRWEDLGKLVNWIEGLPPEGRERARTAQILTAFARHGPRYREQLAENGPWLERLRQSGRDADAWMHPPAITLTRETQTLTIGPATDPREVFLMGSWFSTCLDVVHGSNRASVIANAAEANKAVVYAWSPDGKPIARKLVCVTRDLRLIGFSAYYVSNDWSAVQEILERYCAEWAARAGFALADGGHAENLGGGFWYDDGVTPWSQAARKSWAEARASSPLPDPAAPAEESLEQAWAAAVRGDDPALLEGLLASAGPSHWRESAAYWWVVKFPARAAERPAWWEEVSQNRWDVLEHLAAAGRCTGPASPLYWGRDNDARTEGVVRSALDALATVPPAVGPIRDVIAQIARIKGSGNTDDCFYCSSAPPPGVALVPVAEILRLLHNLHRVMHHSPRCVSDWWVDHWTWVLRLAWLREQDSSPLLRAWREDQSYCRKVLLALCRLEFIPDLIRELRRTARRGSDQAELKAINEALAVWGSPHELQRRSGGEAIPETTDPQMIATDSRRPLGERLTAAAAHWAALPAEDDFRRVRTAVEWAVAFGEEERPLLPEPLRRGLAAALIQAQRFYSRRAWPMLSWLKTFPADEQVELLRAAPDVAASLDFFHYGEAQVLIQSLVSPDAATAQAARCCLRAAGLDAALTLRLLDEAFTWLHPDVVEPLAAEVLPHVADRLAMEAAARELRSVRLQRLIATGPT